MSLINVLISIVFAFLLLACGGSGAEVTSDMIAFPKEGEESGSLPVMAFDSLILSFDTIAEGVAVNRTFKFTNAGRSPLVISQVTANCGCTIPKTWPRNPVDPGETGQIEVAFDSNGRAGSQVKTITVVANTRPASHTLTLKGAVMGPGD